MKRTTRIALAAAVVVAVPAVAYASNTGTYNAVSGSIVFFYGRSSGGAQSKDFSGASSSRLCLDAPGAHARTMVVGNLNQNRTLAFDPTLRTLSAYYSDPQKVSSSASLSPSSRYYARADWNYTSAEGSNANGYSRRC